MKKVGICAIMFYVTEHRTKMERRDILKREIDIKKELKIELGQIIKSNREAKGDSQRGLAKAIDLPNSNLKYIEDGINAPSFEIYKKIMIELNPNSKDRERMDYLYSGIRGTPPPDICEIVMNNPSLYGVLRAIDIESKISNEHVKKFAEIISAGNKGE